MRACDAAYLRSFRRLPRYAARLGTAALGKVPDVATETAARSTTVGVVVVHGRSMEPTLHEGDALLVGWGWPVRIGGLAVVRLPDAPGRPRGLSVKRVTSRDPVDPSRWWVERDHEREGVDSWQVGGLADRDVLGRVLVRVPGWVPTWVYRPSPSG